MWPPVADFFSLEISRPVSSLYQQVNQPGDAAVKGS
jgi:hypothetical protein